MTATTTNMRNTSRKRRTPGRGRAEWLFIAGGIWGGLVAPAGGVALLALAAVLAARKIAVALGVADIVAAQGASIGAAGVAVLAGATYGIGGVVAGAVGAAALIKAGGALCVWWRSRQAAAA